MNRRARSIRLAVGVAAASALAACGESPTGGAPALPELIAFQSSPSANENEVRDLYVMRPDGSGPVRIVSGLLPFAPDWSPDGRRIVFTNTAAGDQNLYVVDADGSNLHRITQGYGPSFHPAWSPDGRQIAFAGSLNSAGILSVSPDGTGVRMLRACEQRCVWPEWSPDGSRIAFVQLDRSASGSTSRIFVMRADGSNVTPLNTGLQQESQPAWSPDGTRIVFAGIGESALRYDVYVANADGTGLKRLTRDPDIDASPQFSRDGSRIVFETGRDGSPNIYVMDVDGANPVRLTNFPGRHRMPAWRP